MVHCTMKKESISLLINGSKGGLVCRKAEAVSRVQNGRKFTKCI